MVDYSEAAEVLVGDVPVYQVDKGVAVEMGLVIAVAEDVEVVLEKVAEEEVREVAEKVEEVAMDLEEAGVVKKGVEAVFEAYQPVS